MLFEHLTIVLICTAIQNLFGVGILVFGTPILLGLGYDLISILGILCPASFCVSLIQIITNRDAQFPRKGALFQSTIGVIFGTFFLSVFAVPKLLYAITAFAMFAAGGLRLNSKLHYTIGSLLNKCSPYFYFFNGIFHGFSNLGGILLVLKHSFSSASISQALLNTATVYLLYVTAQMIVLLIGGHNDIFWSGATIAPFAACLSALIGQRPLGNVSQKKINFGLGLFFVLVGFILCFKAAQ